MIEIFLSSPEFPFAGFPVLIIGNFLQLPQVNGRPIYLPYTNWSKINQLLSQKFWYLLKYAEITEVIRQRDQSFSDLLNKARTDNTD